MKIKLKNLTVGDDYNVYVNGSMASHSGEEAGVIEIFPIDSYANGKPTKDTGLLGYHLDVDNGAYIYTADMFGE